MAIKTHPAWQEWLATHPNAGEIVPWEPGAVRPHECDVWEHEVALWMMVRGYDEEQTVPAGTVWQPIEGTLHPISYYVYQLPPVTIEAAPEVEEEYLAVDPSIDPNALMAYYGRIIAAHPVMQEIKCNGRLPDPL